MLFERYSSRLVVDTSEEISERSRPDNHHLHCPPCKPSRWRIPPIAVSFLPSSHRPARTRNVMGDTGGCDDPGLLSTSSTGVILGAGDGSAFQGLPILPDGGNSKSPAKQKARA